MEKINSAAVRHINETAARVREENEFLDSLAAPYCAAAEKKDGSVSLALGVFAAAPPVLHRRILNRLLKLLGAGEKDFTAEHYEALAKLVQGGSKKVLDLPHGVSALCDREKLMLFKASPPPEDAVLLPGTVTDWGGYELTLTAAKPGESPPEGAVALANLTFPLTVGVWNARERMTLSGKPAPRSLKRLFKDFGISPPERERTPVIRCGGKTAAVCGIGADRAYAPDGQSGVFFLKWNIKK